MKRIQYIQGVFEINRPITYQTYHRKELKALELWISSGDEETRTANQRSC